MAEFNDIVRLAVDSYKGNVTKYSVDESQEVLRKALIEANNGSTKLDVKAIRDGKCPNLFALIETILQKVVNEGLREDEYFNQLVEYRNIAAGDQNLFEVEDASLFTVSKAAQGTQAIRRQRLPGITTAKIDTDFHVVKIYDELQRVLAGSVDWNKAIQKVGESFRQNILKEVYALWEGVNASALGGNAFFPAAGAYDEATLLNLVEHVEAAAGGKTATIIGTKAALRKIAPSIQGVESRGDLYTMGLE